MLMLQVTPCCTANHVQGWPKFAMYTVLTTNAPENAIVISIFAPVTATMPHHIGGGNVTVVVTTDYPFGDNISIQVLGVTTTVPLKVRIPGWATNAIVTINGKKGHPVIPSTYYKVTCRPGDTKVVVELNPEIRVETGWGQYNGTDLNAVVVLRGPLLFALGLGDEWQKFWSHSRDSTYVEHHRPYHWQKGYVQTGEISNSPIITRTKIIKEQMGDWPLTVPGSE